ncbi:MAG: hypothetical protein IV097_10430 [Burkholderiaceae bacterium]|nr:hypothetical protein [Burkholderiaceae bacterium]
MRVDHTQEMGQLPRSEAADRRSSDLRSASVWQREMEKAQAQMWFKETIGQEGQAPPAEQARSGRSPVSSRVPVKAQPPGRDDQAIEHDMTSKMRVYAYRSFALPEPQVHQAIEARRRDNAHWVDSPCLAGEPPPVLLIARAELADDPQQDPQNPMARHTSGAVNTAQSTPHLEPGLPAEQARPTVVSTSIEPKLASQNLCSRTAAPMASALTPGAPAMPGQAHARAMSHPAEFPRRTNNIATGTEPKPPDRAPDPTTSRPPARASIEAQQALRLHAEWHGDEVHVWVGKDGRVKLSHTQLRRWVTEAIVPAQLRLASLTCNGTTIAIDDWSPPANEQATPNRGASEWPT